MEKGLGNKGRGEGYLSWRDKVLPLDKDESDVATDKWRFIKFLKGKTCVRMRCLILIGHIN